MRPLRNPFEHIAHLHSSPELLILASRHGPSLHPHRAPFAVPRSGRCVQRASPESALLRRP
eukprot:1126806-Alexandrium_andersonii.AAC.1